MPECFVMFMQCSCHSCSFLNFIGSSFKYNEVPFNMKCNQIWSCQMFSNGRNPVRMPFSRPARIISRSHSVRWTCISAPLLHNSGSLVYICLHCLHSINSHPFDPLRLWFTILKIATWIALITLCLRVIKLTFSFRISIADFDPFDPFESIYKISNFLFVLACQQIFNQLFKLKNSQVVNCKCNLHIQIETFNESKWVSEI